MKISIIIPTYNEKENIEKIVGSVFSVTAKIPKHKFNILVVDDNSPDGTQDIVKRLQKKYKALHLITGKKEGLGRAYMRGMKYASSKLGAEVMFEMDADFSHDPKEIPNFVKQIDQGSDLVIGSRYIPGGSIPENWGPHRKVFSVAGNLIVRLTLFHLSHHDWTTGYRAVRTSLYKKIAPDMETFKGYTFQVSFLHKAFQKDAKITEVPIHFVDRVYGHSKIGGEYVINLLKYLLIADLTNPPRFLRFLVVGTIGFVIQTVIYTYFWKTVKFDPSVATIIGAEFAIISNFIFNNFWTFSDRKQKAIIKLIPQFVSFNIVSVGSPIIQAVTIKSITTLVNSSDPVTWFSYILGIFLGLIWNYTMYNKIVWKKKQ